MTRLYPIKHRCNRCGAALIDTDVRKREQVNCETLRVTLSDGHVVTYEGLRTKIECHPERTLTLPHWVPEEEFDEDFHRVAETIRAQVRNGRERYRVYARYRIFCQPTETGRIKTAKQYTGICIDSTRSLYHGYARVKVGEVTI